MKSLEVLYKGTDPTSTEIISVQITICNPKRHKVTCLWLRQKKKKTKIFLKTLQSLSILTRRWENTVSSCLLLWAEGEGEHKMQPHKGRNTTGLWTCSSSSVTPEIPELLLASTTENKHLRCPGKNFKLCGTIKARKQFQLFTALQDLKKDRNSSQSFQNILHDIYLRTWFWHQSQQNQFFSSILGTQILKEKLVPSHVPTLGPSQLCDCVSLCSNLRNSHNTLLPLGQKNQRHPKSGFITSEKN